MSNIPLDYSGYLKQISSSNAITQQPQDLPRKTLYKDKTKIETHLVVKRGARRVYVYRNKQVLKTFPIAIGKPGWETPLGKYQVKYMKKDPIFKNFKTGEIIQPGSKNPLGKRLIVFMVGKKFHLGFHGTNEAKFIGQAVSHGCIRMHNKDVIALYELVNVGTPVKVLP
ncbi:L,D-transpeptidase [Nostoc sp. ATCC 53789]|uniref:L,D-transpeptidase n=1 Tax=Nostoc sp. ATCC 53789 TaxID=76335 RepID=UPI001FD79B59|nr:L,D-transpeptidase [Nostoc sp. ATCC 53789]